MNRSKVMLAVIFLSTNSAQAGIFNHLFKYKGFEFNGEKQTCLHKKDGKLGYNKKYYGPCGDLTGFDSKRLVKKINRGLVSKQSLIGAKVIGLDLTGAKFEKVNFSYSDLRGTNLGKVKFVNDYDLVAIGAKYDSTTVLPFSDYTAISVYRMKKMDYRSITTVYPNPMDILKANNPVEVVRKLKEIASLTTEYHTELFEIVENADELTLNQIEMILDSAYVSAVDLTELRKQLRFASKGEKARLIDLINAYEGIGSIVNNIINTGITKISDTENVDNLLRLVNRYFPSRNNQDISTGMRFIAKEYSSRLTDNGLIELVEILDTINSRYNFSHIVKLGQDLLEREDNLTASNLHKIVDAGKSNKGQLLQSLSSLFESFTFEEYLSFLTKVRDNSFYFENRAKISDRNFENDLVLATYMYRNQKDVVLTEAITRRGFLTVEEIDTTFRKVAYSLFNLVSTNYNRIQGNTLDKARRFALKEKSRLGDLVLAHYFTNVQKNIKLTEYSENLNYIHSLSGFVLSTAHVGIEFDIYSVIEFSSQVNGNAKKALVKRFLQLVGKITTDQMLLLYEKTVFDLNDLLVNLDIIADLDYKNTVKIARHFKNRVSDQIIKFFIQKEVVNTGVTVRDLILLADVSYSIKEEVLTKNYQYIKDWNIINVVVLMNNTSRSNKNGAGEYFLKNQVTTDGITLEDMRKIVAAGYNYYGGADDLLINNLDKIQGFGFTMLNEIVSSYNRSKKDILIKYYLENETSLSMQKLIRATSYSYNNRYKFVTEFFNKVNDKSANTVVKLMNTLYRNNKNNIATKYLKSLSTVTSKDLLVVAQSTYSVRDNLIMENLDKVNDLSVANASSIVNSMYRYQKDTFLKKAILLVNDLSVINIYDFAALSYSSTAKDEVLKTGLRRLGEIE